MSSSYYSRFNKIRYFHWDMLRDIGASNFSKATILMPVFGYMILFNESLIEYLSVNSTLIFGSFNVLDKDGSQQIVGGDLAYRLYCFYFGFSFLGIGSLFFNYWCPNVFIFHKYTSNYIDHSIKYMSPKRLRKHIKSLRELLDTQEPEKYDSWYSEQKVKTNGILNAFESADVRELKSENGKLKNCLIDTLKDEYIKHRITFPFKRLIIY